MATHSSILVWKIPMDREAWQATVQEVAKSWSRLSNKEIAHNTDTKTHSNWVKDLNLSPDTI